MKKWAPLIIAAIVLCAFGGCNYSLYNTLVDDEEGVRAQEGKIDLSITTMVNKIESQGITITSFRETLTDVLTKTIGEGGRAAQGGTFVNAVSERYPEIPQTVWRDFSATANAEYEAIKTAQTTKVAQIEAFRKRLRDPKYLLVKSIGGFPTIDLEKHSQLILSTTARKARETGTLETVNPLK